MSTPQVATVDCSTGIETVRDMTTEEIAEQEALNAEIAERQAAEQAEADAKAAAKASGDAKLKELGLTDDEIAAR
jgi:hypothetical protein